MQVLKLSWGILNMQVLERIIFDEAYVNASVYFYGVSVVCDVFCVRITKLHISLINQCYISWYTYFQGNSGLKPREGEITSRPWQWPIDFRVSIHTYMYIYILYLYILQGSMYNLYVILEPIQLNLILCIKVMFSDINIFSALKLQIYNYNILVYVLSNGNQKS